MKEHGNSRNSRNSGNVVGENLDVAAKKDAKRAGFPQSHGFHVEGVLNCTGYQGEENRGGNIRAERVGEDAVSAVQSGAATGGFQVLLLRREGNSVLTVGKIVLRRDEDEHVCYISLVGRKANGYRCLCREEPVGCRQKEIGDDSATGTVYHPTGRFLLKIADL